MIFIIQGITTEGKPITKRIVSSLDSTDIMDKPHEYGFRVILSISHVADERLEIIGEEPPEEERRSK
jgi:hypothetical protein